MTWTDADKLMTDKACLYCSLKAQVRHGEITYGMPIRKDTRETTVELYSKHDVPGVHFLGTFCMV